MDIQEVCKELERLLPRHKAGMTIEHNPHLVFHSTAEGYIENYDDEGCWPSNEAKARAIAANDFWELHWYPDTTVGFYTVYAPTLFEALQHAKNTA